jgi:hypothetical protein
MDLNARLQIGCAADKSPFRQGTDGPVSRNWNSYSKPRHWRRHGRGRAYGTAYRWDRSIITGVAGILLLAAIGQILF